MEEAYQRRQDDYGRWLNNDIFEFWRACKEPRCRREHSCSGDLHACSARRWAAIPEEEKVWFRAGMKAIIAGASFEEAVRMGEAERDRWRALQAEIAKLFPGNNRQTG